MATMPERMATQETLMAAVQKDVTEIKADVKTLLGTYNQSKGRKALIRAIPWAALFTSFTAAIVAIFVK